MALRAGDMAPDFKLPSITGSTQGEFQLSSYRGRNVIVLFYALDFTPVCSAELPAFKMDQAKLAGSDAVIVAISTDTVFSHKAFARSLGGLDFALASDRWPYAEVAKAYGIFPASKHQFGAVNDRATFIVDKNGRIAWEKVYDLTEVPDVGEIASALKTLP